MSANTLKPLYFAILAAGILATGSACSSSDQFKADAPTDPAMAPASNMTSHDAPYDNRGRGN